ncbi:MAG: excinuclease ABC subunit UvrC [Bacteroidota bacterium]|nr:excinuclease ABC subunit UvrC [Bacteroidota bacterium]MDQ6902316.1 excinuclease ABC subunit UvrC [Bacteroidota bacterium]
MTTDVFQTLIETLPKQPGIYKYFDDQNELIYVGKAKNIRKRISSYFTKTFTGYKTHELVRRINKIEFTIVDSEQDAFLLENSLIKQFQPKFNINLKDDKSYPYLVIKNEPFPRVFLTRSKINDGSQYLGPFTSVGKVRELLLFIKQNVQLRTCKLNLTEGNIKKKKFKVCLEYHLGNCKGPCEGLQTAADYSEGLAQLKNLMKGNLNPVIQHFKNEMEHLANELKFEKAEAVRKKIDHLQNYKAKSKVVNEHVGNVDVFSILKDGHIAYVNYLMVSEGTIILTKTTILEPKLDETSEEVLLFAIAQLRSTFHSESNEIIVPFEIEYPESAISVIVPKAGDKKKLLELSEKNVNYFIEELKKKKMLQLEGKSDKEKQKVLQKLQSDLHLPALPEQIECFDNSNFQGSYPVAAMVYFRNGMPDKSQYRKFNIKTVSGINDFASMKEVVCRRYKRILNENLPLPQLIIIDGGKGQLNAAVEGLSELNLEGKTTIVGLAKNEEEIFFPGDKQSIKLPWDSESLKLIRRIRDEVHRFGIGFHRNQRSRGTFINELEMIKGIGKNTADTLLKKFKSVKKIKELSYQELAEVTGTFKATIIAEHFKNSMKEE